MTFDEICELRRRGPTELTAAQCKLLIDEVWHLRCVINVLDITVRLWKSCSSHVVPAFVLHQQYAAEEALKTVED